MPERAAKKSRHDEHYTDIPCGACMGTSTPVCSTCQLIHPNDRPGVSCLTCHAARKTKCTCDEGVIAYLNQIDPCDFDYSGDWPTEEELSEHILDFGLVDSVWTRIALCLFDQLHLNKFRDDYAEQLHRNAHQFKLSWLQPEGR